MLKSKFRFGNIADEGNTQDQPKDQNDGQGVENKNPAHEHENDGSQQNEKFIPKSRFDEVNDKFKKVQSQLDDILKEKTQAELDAKKKNGEFENLYQETSQELEKYKNDFTNTSERVGQLEEIIGSLVEAELETVPEELRDLVPENMTPEQKLSWITNAKKKGLFGATKNDKSDKPLGDSTNNDNQQQNVDLSKLTVTQLLKNAYGSK